MTDASKSEADVSGSVVDAGQSEADTGRNVIG